MAERPRRGRARRRVRSVVDPCGGEGRRERFARQRQTDQRHDRGRGPFGTIAGCFRTRAGLGGLSRFLVATLPGEAQSKCDCRTVCARAVSSRAAGRDGRRQRCFGLLGGRQLQGARPARIVAVDRQARLVVRTASISRARAGSASASRGRPRVRSVRARASSPSPAVAQSPRRSRPPMAFRRSRSPDAQRPCARAAPARRPCAAARRSGRRRCAAERPRNRQ